MLSCIQRLTLGWLILASPAVLGDSTDQVDSIEQTSEFITEQKAVERALEVFGTRTEEGYRATAAEDSTAIVTVRDSTTPFLSTVIDGRTAWRVVVWLGAKHFQAFIDAEDGKLIKIISRTQDFDEKAWHKPLAEVAKQQIYPSERYYGFPDVNPAVAFINVITSPSTMGYDGLRAQEITAIYIVYSNANSKPRPVWELYLYGLQTIVSIKYPEFPFYQRDFSRVTVDAMTGEFIVSSNTPRPK